jgi:hypothetical protein
MIALNRLINPDVEDLVTYLAGARDYINFTFTKQKKG